VSFQSFHFFLFLGLVVGISCLLGQRPGWRKNFLLLASYYFYMAWDWRFAGLLLVLTAVNFAAGRGIARATLDRTRKAWLIAALATCLGSLAFFKYANFFVEELQTLFGALGFESELGTLRIVLPLGISFFTFQALSYVLDVYRRQQDECEDLRDFALFVAFFPTVLAGPITRAKQLLPQFSKLEAPTAAGMEHGLALIIRGLVKKVVFADVLASNLVDPAFASPGEFAPFFLLVALYAYSFQIYMDVSAYTDIARGAAFMCGFKLPENFDRPYIATTVSNFWQRWHISMSSFFRDYLYFGLGGSQRGHVYLNLMMTFVAIGVWHGAGWNFVLYGFIHGTVVCLERWNRSRRARLGLPPPTASSFGWFIGLLVTFHVVVFSRVLFRAPDLASAADYMHQLFTGASTHMPFGMMSMTILLLAAVLHWGLPKAGPMALSMFTRLPALLQAVLMVALLYCLLALSVGTAPFVYFQF